MEILRNAIFGVELFVLDDGWFGDKYPRDKADSGLGDWVVNKKKLPHGIGYLADYAVNKGVRFGIWIEPEMVNPRSVLAEKYPEWIVKTDKYTPYVERNQWLLDLSNPESALSRGYLSPTQPSSNTNNSTPKFAASSIKRGITNPWD